MKTVKVKCPAKLNLYLDITHRMPNGYHIMEMVMQAVNLFDTVYLTLNDTGEVTLSMEDSPIPADQTNLAWRCARLLLDETQSRHGVEIRIHKEIPSEAGLGGGSADGAGVLVGLNALLGSPLRTERLIELGARVGSDIPFCIQGGTAMVRGYGEILEALEPLDDCRILIAKPAKGVPTAECFARYDASGKPYGIPGTPLIKKAINADDLSAVCKLLYNALEEAADLPEVQEIRQIMLESGAAGSRMTGSGSAVFGIFPRSEQLENASRTLKKLGYYTRRCSPVEYGATITE